MNRRDLSKAMLATAGAALVPGRSAAQAIAQAAAPRTYPPLAPDLKYAPQVAAQLARVSTGAANGPFRPNWNSLAGYRVPEWFRDAKFGVFLHWGLYSVPAFANEWYSRNMYVQGAEAFEYHRAVYGPQDKFGYKDFIPRLRAENFDPHAWADTFVRAGIKYVVPVGEHCDGFPMYDCGFTDWSAAKMGPKRDLVGEIIAAARARGLHTGISSHRAEHWFWYDGGRAYPSDVTDPRYRGLYGPAAQEGLPSDPATFDPNSSHLERWWPPDRPFLDDWLARTTEMIDRYRPELIYLDWWINHPLFAPRLQALAAYYYNRAKSGGYGPVLTYKEEAFAPGTALLDIERGKLDLLRLTPWQTDTSVSLKSWGYVRDDTYRTATSLLQDLVDVVSKNGCLLLNIGPRADGMLPPEGVAVLEGVGAWLKLNGEAIYGTRPWTFYGEGTINSGASEKSEAAKLPFTAADIRFTTKAGALYAIGLEPPADGVMRVKTLYRGSPFLAGEISAVRWVEDARPLSFRRTPEILEIDLPQGRPPGPYAVKLATA